MALAIREHDEFNRNQQLGLVPYREFEPYQTPASVLPIPFPYYVTNVLPCDPLQPVEYGKFGGAYPSNGFDYQGNGFHGNGHNSGRDFQQKLNSLESDIPRLSLRKLNGEKRVSFRDDGLNTSRESRTSQPHFLNHSGVPIDLARRQASSDDAAIEYNVLPHHLSKVFKLDPRRRRARLALWVSGTWATTWPATLSKMATRSWHSM